jgi:tetratricopeptide (TPR) repeat protein
MAVLVVLLPAMQAQTAEQPKLFVPRRPPSRQELDRREALKLYAIGLVCQRGDRLLEALQNFEKARQLDPRAAEVYKALVPLYLALERPSAALAACKKAVELDPEDFQIWAVYARQLKAQGQLKESRDALIRAVRCKGLKKHPEFLQQIYFDLGVLHEELKEYTRAIAAFGETAKILEKPEHFLELGPFSLEEINSRASDIYERIGRLCVQLKKYDQAVTAFRHAQDKAKDRGGRLNYNLAEVCRAQGKDKDALRYLDAYLRLQPQGLEAYEMKIALLTRLGRQREIVSELRKYAGNDRYNIGLKLLLARQYQAHRQFGEAESIYLDLTRGNPTANLYRGLFNLYKNWPKKGMREVLRLLNEALAKASGKDSDSVKAAAAATARVMLAVLRDDAGLVKPLLAVARRQVASGKNLAYQTRHYLAVLAARAKKLDEAERFYRSCLREVTIENESAIYGGLLKVLWLARKHEEIIKLCRQGLKKTQVTNHVLFHLDLAQALSYFGKAKEAIEQANKAVEKAGDDILLFTRLRRVSVFSRLERHDKAIAECKELLKKYTSPSDVHEIRYILSGVYTAAKDYAKAEAELARLIKAYPDEATPYNDLGYIWADRNKNLKQAEEYIRKAIDLDRKQKKNGTALGTDEDKDNAAYIDSLGWVLFRRGQLDAARRELEKASSLPGGDDDPVVFDHLGDVYFRLDQPERARTAWKKAVALYEVEKTRKMDERYKEIKQKLQLLERETQP